MIWRRAIGVRVRDSLGQGHSLLTLENFEKVPCPEPLHPVRIFQMLLTLEIFSARRVHCFLCMFSWVFKSMEWIRNGCTFIYSWYGGSRFLLARVRLATPPPFPLLEGTARKRKETDFPSYHPVDDKRHTSKLRVNILVESTFSRKERSRPRARAVARILSWKSRMTLWLSQPLLNQRHDHDTFREIPPIDSWAVIRCSTLNLFNNNLPTIFSACGHFSLSCVYRVFRFPMRLNLGVSVVYGSFSPTRFFRKWLTGVPSTEGWHEKDF